MAGISFRTNKKYRFIGPPSPDRHHPSVLMNDSGPEADVDSILHRLLEGIYGG
jgi:hypothetical protein